MIIFVLSNYPFDDSNVSEVVDVFDELDDALYAVFEKTGNEGAIDIDNWLSSEHMDRIDELDIEFNSKPDKRCDYRLTSHVMKKGS